MSADIRIYGHRNLCMRIVHDTLAAAPSTELRLGGRRIVERFYTSHITTCSCRQRQLFPSASCLPPPLPLSTLRLPALFLVRGGWARKNASPRLDRSVGVDRRMWCADSRCGIPNFFLVSHLHRCRTYTAKHGTTMRKHATDHITDTLASFHWLRAPERIKFKLAVIVYRGIHGTAPLYLSDLLHRVSDITSRRRLRSSTSSELVIPLSRLVTL